MFGYSDFGDIGFGDIYGSTGNIQYTGPRNTTFTNCTFDTIYNQAIYAIANQNTMSSNNKYLNVGTGNGTSGEILTTSSIFSNQVLNSDNDYFYRTAILNATQSLAFLGEYSGRILGNNRFCPIGLINTTSVSTPLINFTVINQSVKYKIHYNYSNSSFTRTGTLDLSINSNGSSVYTSLSDEFDVSSGLVITPLQFTVSTSGSTVSINYNNNSSPSTYTGSFEYWYETLS